MAETIKPIQLQGSELQEIMAPHRVPGNVSRTHIKLQSIDGIKIKGLSIWGICTLFR